VGRGGGGCFGGGGPADIFLRVIFSGVASGELAVAGSFAFWGRRRGGAEGRFGI
jgi:hypothetical protein